MDIYKAILLSILEPIAEVKLADLRVVADGLANEPSSEQARAISEMVRRAANFIKMSLALAEEVEG